MAEPVDFYFDFASPYGYLASTRIDALAAKYGRRVLWRPVLLGAIFKVTGMRPNLEQPLRGDYLLHDVPRFARLLGVPLTMPANTPISALVPSRAYWWLFAQDEDLARRLACALYDAHWGQGRDISQVPVVVEVAAGLGIDGPALEAGIQADATKERLRAETGLATERGVFGSPFVIVDGELFWGADRLDQVERWLAGGW